MESYYRNPQVRTRIGEYLGSNGRGQPTCVYLSRSDAPRYDRLEVRSPDRLPYFLNRRLDVARSLWDTDHLLAHLDIEYLNFDLPAEPYLHPQRCFALQEPVVEAVYRILGEYGIEALHMITGRGHHLVWQVSQDSPAFAEIRDLGRVPPTLERTNRLPHPPRQLPVSDELGAAFAGLSLLMEFLACRIKRAAAPDCPLPVEITDILVSQGEWGRELVLIDISEYGDPLHTRTIRVPFTIYRRPWTRGLMDSPYLASQIPRLVAIPRHLHSDLSAALALRSSERQVAELAGSASTRIPDRNEGMLRLLRDYEGSAVQRFHRWYHDYGPAVGGEALQGGLEELPAALEALPACLQPLLEEPSDLLVQPTGARLVTLALLAAGWHPHRVAGLLGNVWQRTPRWTDRWIEYDPHFRAVFYTRLFTGQFLTGIDDLEDFEPAVLKAMGIPLRDPCLLWDLRKSLLERREHERLGDRPFDGLLLP